MLQVEIANELKEKDYEIWLVSAYDGGLHNETNVPLAEKSQKPILLILNSIQGVN